MKKHNAISHPVGRVAIAIMLVTFAVNSVFCQDTVRLNDPRFLFPQLPHGDFYFYRTLRTMSPLILTSHFEGGFGHECFLEKGGGATIYGIAVALYEDSPYIGDSDQNYLWLKIMDEVPIHLPLNTPQTLLDSVKITSNSETKTLVLDEIRTNDTYWSITDSVSRFAYKLYCGYFSHPVHITDSSFFVLAYSTRGEHKIPAYKIYPPEIELYRSYLDFCWELTIRNFWMPLLPIIVPPPGETPDSDSDPNAIRSFDGSVYHDVSIFPNPAHSCFSVKSDTRMLQVELYDTKGTLCRKWNGFQDRYSLSGINTGVYAVRIKTQHSVVTKKLIVSE